MKKPDEKKLVIVIPILDERENVSVLHEELSKVLAAEPEKAEFLFVDDGSTDDGPDWLLNKQKEDPRIRLLSLSRNFGHQVAISAGLDRADGDAVVIIDSDLQDPPSVIIDMLKKWREGYEVVYGVRKDREGEGFLKKSFAKIFYRLFRLMTSLNVPVDSGDFRLLDRKVVEAVRSMRETHRYLRAMTTWVGFKQCAVEYSRQPRHAGETKYPVWKSFRLAWDGLTSFSGTPLRWVAGFGFVACLMGVIWFLNILCAALTNPAGQERGWASVMAAILFMGGVQLVSVGFLGQYLSRTFEETKKRPLYVVKSDSAESENGA